MRARHIAASSARMHFLTTAGAPKSRGAVAGASTPRDSIRELTSNPNPAAQGALVEARVEKGLGTVATIIAQRGKVRA